MRATVFFGKGDLRVEQVPDPRIEQPTDAIVRVTHACICGTDLWFYRGLEEYAQGRRTGHEWMGVVEEVGAEVRGLRRGDRVIAPFMYSDGRCEFCLADLQTSCVNGNFWSAPGLDGGQGEAVRAPYADTTLVRVPDEVANDKAVLRKLLPLTDVMGTGHHAARCARVARGSTVVVVGDGAVGLCGVLAARRLGAERIIMMGRHPQRLAIARGFGATDVVEARGGEGVKAVKALTQGGAPHVLECVGDTTTLDTAIGVARPGGAIGYVGAPHLSEPFRLLSMFRKNVTLAGGVAPVRAHLPELMGDVIAGRLDPSPVLDLVLPLDRVAEGYAAMDGRTCTKVMLEM